MAATVPCSSRLFPPCSNRSPIPIMAFSSNNGDLELPSNLEITGARRSLLAGFASLQRPYTPFPLVGWNRHVETIFAAFFRSLPAVPLRRQCLRTKDGGAVALDWVSGDDRRLPADSPLLILLPGLTGGSGDTYVRHMLLRARNKGWRVVVFNSRGCAESPVTTPQFYSASFTEDICQVVDHVSARYPKSNIYAVGWSLGANILVRYLGQMRTSTRVLITYMTKLLLELCGGYSRNMQSCLKILVANTISLWQLMLVSFGFKSVDDYYFNSSSSDSIENVRTPLLCIQAANDPIAPSRGIPHEKIKENPHCLLIVTPQGGHLGWVAGDEAPRGAPWTDAVVMEFLEHLNKKGAESTMNACVGQLDSTQQPSRSLTLQIQ